MPTAAPIDIAAALAVKQSFLSITHLHLQISPRQALITVSKVQTSGAEGSSALSASVEPGKIRHYSGTAIDLAALPSFSRANNKTRSTIDAGFRPVFGRAHRR